MSNFEHRIKEDSTEFEKAFLKIYHGSLWTAIEKMKDWQPPKKLVEVPQIVADWFEENEDDLDYRIWKYIRDYDKHKHNVFYKWFNKDDRAIEILIRMQDGYKVKKEQMFYLKHIDFCKTDKHYDWFTIKFSDGALNYLRVEKGQKPATIDCRFTQSEINDMEVGSYEQIAVKVTRWSDDSRGNRAELPN